MNANLRSRFASIASLAKHAQRMSVEDETLLDHIDNIDSELREVIDIVNRERGVDDGAQSHGDQLDGASDAQDEPRTYSVTVLFHVGRDTELKSEKVISDELQSWLESLKAAILDVHVEARRER